VTAVLTESLVRRFGDNTAVAGVDLSVSDGEIYGFLGPNGAGKSTVVRMLCTLLLPSSGRALVAGADVATEPDVVRLRIGAALQATALDDRQTGVEILDLQARLYGLTRAEARRRIEDLRSLIDIGAALEQRVGTYSGGMKRRLDLAAALVHNPQILFLDEPTTGLDPVSRAAVWDEVRRLRSQLGMTIFLTTQYLEEADALADRVGIIDHGRLVVEGSPAELKRSISSDVIVVDLDSDVDTAVAALGGLSGVEEIERHERQVTVCTADGAALLSPVAVALNEAGAAVRNLSLRTPTLDDVFLHLTGARLHEGEDR